MMKPVDNTDNITLLDFVNMLGLPKPQPYQLEILKRIEKGDRIVIAWKPQRGKDCTARIRYEDVLKDWMTVAEENEDEHA